MAHSDNVTHTLSKPGPRYTSYPPANLWTDQVTPQCVAAQLAVTNVVKNDAPISLYVHLPFCERKCLYCGCNVIVTNRRERVDRYIDYLEKEIALVQQHLPTRRHVAQLHWGGGTPTFLLEAQIERLWQLINQHFSILPTAEVALEVDPGITQIAQLQLLRRLGFNRISMGIQDFDPAVQAYVGRSQTVDVTREIFNEARVLGFKGINFDLIYGLPKQTAQTFERTLDEVVEMRPDRIAVFGYAHVPWLHPQQNKFDPALIPLAQQRYDLFQLARQRLSDAGYVSIGLDHFALPDDAMTQVQRNGKLRRNFQGYTVNPASCLVGIGVTAISDLQMCYAQNVKNLHDYYDRLDHGLLPTERGWLLSARDHQRRYVIERLMCDFYIDLVDAASQLGCDVTDLAGATEAAQLKQLAGQGLVDFDGRHVTATELGRVFVRNVAMVFDPYVRQVSATAPPAYSATI